MTKRIALGVFAVSVALLVGALLLVSAAPARAEGPVAATTRTVSGVVWQDYCEADCTAGSSLRRGNGVPNEAEKRLAGVKVLLGTGSCRFSRAMWSTTTDSLGRYTFSGLGSGTYCVMVNSRQSNTAFPKPGVWSRPSGRSSWYLASYTVYGPFSRSGLNFGWDKP